MPQLQEAAIAVTNITHRPWGTFAVLEEGRGYRIKRIEVKPGHRQSLQMHYHRSEHWVVVSGTAKVTCGDREITIIKNQSTYVPQCTPHRLANPGLIPLVIIEVQDGEYLGEDDIIRFEDDYARGEIVPDYAPSRVSSHLQETLPAKPIGDTVNTTQRPWGSFTVLEDATGYKIKRIVVNPTHRLSLQMHHHRSEHWIVVSGTAKVTCGDREIPLGSNQSTYVPQCTPHRLENPGLIPLTIIEVQNGEYLGEDDIIRFQDDYAR